MTGLPTLDEAERRLARAIAWGAIEACVLGRPRFDPARAGLLPRGSLLEPRGCFVTLKKQGALRGCMGAALPDRALWRSLIARAADAALRDPRFDPVAPEELEALSMELSVLSPLMPVSGYREIRLGRHGILLDKRGVRALFLPQVAPEQGWDLETTLARLAAKAGLEPGAWREGCAFQVFEAQVF